LIELDTKDIKSKKKKQQKEEEKGRKQTPNLHSVSETLPKSMKEGKK
jgi:hypothetical protein